ncbi:MAG: SpoIVB peptidase [Firmicutes bacterium]|nr:SpoIVB peptidase [Bacillota bacterium]
MPPRYKKLFSWFLLLLLGLFMLFILPQMIKVQLYPTNLRLVPGQQLQFSLKKPFSIYLAADRPDGITGINGRTKIEKGQSGHCSEVMVTSEREGNGYIEIRFLGLPIRRVNFEIVKMPEIIPGGHAIGVLVAAKGVIVSGHLPVRDDQGREFYPAKEAGIKVGDLIIAINGQTIRRLSELDSLIKSEAEKSSTLMLRVVRGGKTLDLEITPVKKVDRERGIISYLLGLYVEDPAAGVGTLTYYNPQSRQYGALGHKILGFGHSEVSLVNGKIVAARITGITHGNRGEPGEKIGIFSGHSDIIGDIFANTEIGIFGTLYTDLNNLYYPQPIPVSTISEVKSGPAEILTVLSGDVIRRFSIEIQKVYHQSNLRDKGMVIKVTDPELLLKTGGIIQGMSGSPIIQNGKLVGAVTHVFVNDPTRGYGVFAEWMLQMEKNLQKRSERDAS